MPTQTTNYGFTKDDINEPYDVLKVNANLDAIDTEIKEKEAQIGDKANLITVAKTNLVAAINEVKEQNNSLGAYAVASGTNTYTATIAGITALTEGFSIKIKFTNANTGASTLNINSLAAKSILKGNGSALSGGNIKAGQICNLVYNGLNFQLLGEGGEYGTATASDVLSGKKIGTDSGVIEGTIPGKSAATITPSTFDQVIAAGQYLSGDQTIIGDADLISANIKSGANIFGVAGNPNVVDTSAGDAVASQILSGKKAYADGALLTGTMASNGAQSATLTTNGASKTIPAGYTTGGTVNANILNLVADNIKNGVNVGGVVGNYDNSGISKAAATSLDKTLADSSSNDSIRSYYAIGSLGSTGDSCITNAIFFFVNGGSDRSFEISCTSPILMRLIGYSSDPIGGNSLGQITNLMTITSLANSKDKVIVYNPDKLTCTIRRTGGSAYGAINVRLLIE